MNKRLYRLVFDRTRGFCVAVCEHVAAAGKSACGEGAQAPFVALALLAGGGAAAQAQAQAPALPSGASIVRGNASIATNGATLTVTQTSPGLVADWQSFSIGSGAAVRFAQPSTGSIALNRVTGPDPSAIFGSLTANGHLILQNNAGVLFGPGAQVSVGSLVATSLAVDADAALAGHLRLSGGSTASGAVRNEGRIDAAGGGHVVLAAPRVSNAGSIETPAGTTALVAANAVNIDPTGSGLLTISVPVAAIDAQLENSGRIGADGGMVTLQAAATDAALRSVMQVGGVVRARSVEQRGGEIVLSGGASGSVDVSGTLDASGAMSQARGGAISVVGERVALVGAARLDASGDAGGGSIRVGGNFRGAGPLPNAIDTSVGPQVTLDASARQSGNGGSIVVWSDRSTDYRGSLVATGGSLHGDGGNAEVSGKQYLNFAGQADLRAAHGKAGTLLLDPAFLVIGTVANVDGTPGNDVQPPGVAAGDPPVTSNITAAQVANLLATVSLDLESTSTLTVTAPITVAAGGNNTTLTLGSQLVDVEAAMTLNNAALSIATFGSDVVSLNAPIQSSRSIAVTSASINLASTLTAPDVTLTTPNFFSISPAPSGGNSLTGAQVDALLATGNLTLNVTGGGQINVSDPITVPSGGPATALTLDGRTINVNAPLTLSNSALTLQTSPGASEGIQINAPIQSANAIAMTSTSVVSIGADVSGAAGIDIHSAGLFIGRPDSESPPFTLQAPAGRVLVTSSDFNNDFIPAESFGTAPTQFNVVVFGGNTAPLPTTGNVFTTNQTALIDTPPTDIPPISRTYDATTAIVLPPITGTTAQITYGTGEGAVAIDTTTYSVVTGGNFADKNAGTGKAYTLAGSNDVSATDATGVRYLGMAWGPYTRPAGASVDNPVSTVTAAPLNLLGLGAADKVYDATANATLTGAPLISPFAGDVVNLTGTGAGTFSDKNVGTAKAVFVTGYGLGGTDSLNYTLVVPTNLSASITPAPLTIGGLGAQDKVYDSTRVATLTGTPTVSPFAGDTVTVIGTGVGTFVDKNVGTGKTVIVSGYTFGGADGSNYTLVPPGITASITPFIVTPAGVAANNRPDNGSTTVSLNLGQATIPGVFAGDVVALDASNAVGRVDTPDPGAGKPVRVFGLALQGADAINYALAVRTGGEVVIAGAPVTVTIQPSFFDDFRSLQFNEYLQGVSDAQEPFRRAMAEALAAGFGKENIRKQLLRGLVYETGLAPPAIDSIDSAKRPPACDGAGSGYALTCR